MHFVFFDYVGGWEFKVSILNEKLQSGKNERLHRNGKVGQLCLSWLRVKCNGLVESMQYSIGSLRPSNSALSGKMTKSEKMQSNYLRFVPIFIIRVLWSYQKAHKLILLKHFPQAFSFQDFELQEALTFAELRPLLYINDSKIRHIRKERLRYGFTRYT